MKTKIILVCIIAILGCMLFYSGCNNHFPDVGKVVTSDTIHISDTIVKIDTIRIEKPIAKKVYVSRIDTIFQRDTLTITVPIERKKYQSNEYKAVIEGYKASIISMSVYPKTYIIKDTIQITNTRTIIKPHKWAITAGGGLGYGFNKRIEPYIGINIGYIIFSK